MTRRSMTTRAAFALWCAAVVAGASACEGDVGLMTVTIVTAPDSTVMDDVVRARMTLDNPATVVEATRDGNGQLFLDLDVEANGVTGSVMFEGFDSAGSLIAVGRSGPLPIAAFDGRVDVYVAPPLSFAEAPVELETARSDIGISLLSFGVLLAGGRDAAGNATDDMAIYNVYDHALQIGAPLPEARFGMTNLGGSFGIVYLFGGTDPAGDPSAALWRLDTNVAPGGSYQTQRTDDSLARTGAAGAPLGQEAFLVTGDPPVIVDGLGGRAAAIPDAAPIAGTVTSVSIDGTVYTLVAGRGASATGATLFVGNQWIELSPPADMERTGHRTLALPGGDMLTLGGATLASTPASAIRFDPVSRSFTTIEDFLATPRTNPAAATTGRHLVVAGGIDSAGETVSTAEVFDAVTLAPIATVPMVVPRSGAAAATLASGQVLVVGGVDASGAPVAVIELFTPGP